MGIASTDGKLVRVNKSFCQMLGYTEDELLQKTNRDLTHPDDIPLTNSYMNQIDKGEIDSYEIEKRYVHKNGTIVYALLLLSFHRDKNDDDSYYIAQIQNISEHKRTEDQILLQSEILTRMSEAVYLIKKNDALIVYTNPKFEELFGYDHGEMIGKHVSIVNYPTELDPEEKAGEIIKSLDKEGIWRGEIQNIKKDGTPFWCFASVSTLKHSKYGEVIVSIHTDITERKLTQEEFKESAENLRLLLKHTVEAIYGLDTEGNCTFANPACFSFLGYENDDDLIGKNMHNLIHYKLEDGSYYPENECHIYEAFINNTSTRVDDEVFWRADGSSFPVEYWSHPVYNDSGEVRGSVVTFIDISERKEKDKKNKILEEQLRQAVKMQAVGTLAGGIAHEFNNLLGVIMGCADMARDEVAKDSFAKVQLDKVMKASFRVKDLVKQILTFSRQSQQQRISTDPCSHVKESIKLIQTSIPSSVEIKSNAPSSCGNILIDPTEIQQIVMNFCSNAVWAMKEHGVLTINLIEVDLTDRDELISKGLLVGRYVELSFNDTGCGMDQETLSRIFDPFFTTKEVGKGTGMGLSIVHGIIESYGGAITVESEVGKGSTFHIYFPITEKPATQEHVEDEKHPRGAEQILFVDDEEMYAEMGKDMISRLGYNVDLRIDSIQALESFKAAPDKYDLVISDQIMPGLSGEEIVKEIRLIRPDIPIILCSGYSSQMDEEKAKSIGTNAFVYKPITIKDIAKLIRKVLDAT